ncbi:MAG: hypothetical protein LBR55_04520, partial [Bacteroidales bacterium]|nr:hypothetical protein [Bacteroidales bacterium]
TTVSAQNLSYGSGKDSITCLENMTVYQLRYKNEEKTGSFTPETYNAWRKTMAICPQGSKTMYYPHGVTLFKAKYNAETDAAAKKQYYDTIMSIFDKRIAAFGEEAKYNGIKAYEIMQIDPSKFADAYVLSKASLDELGMKTEAVALSTLMQSAYAKYQNNAMTKLEAIQLYEQISEVLAANAGSKFYDPYVPYIEGIFLQLQPSCDDMTALFQSQYDKAPHDVEVLKKITKNLERKCASSDLYFKAAVELDKLEPSARSKRNIGEMYTAKKENSSAIQYFNEALKLEEDNAEKAEIYYRMAVVVQNSPQQSANYAEQAGRLNSSMGKAYLLIASQYVAGANACAQNAEYPSVVKWTALWLAVDKCNQAKAADPSIASQANQQIANYKAHFPDAEDLFGYNITTGSTQTMTNCWISGTTKAQTK